MRKVVTRGLPYPLGATPTRGGVNFAVYSRHATQVLVVLYDDLSSSHPSDVIPLEARTGHIRHAHVQGLYPGQLYNLRATGPYVPEHGLRFNERKLLLDPYAKALTAKARNRDHLLEGYDTRSPDQDLSIDLRDSSPIVPRCIVVDDTFDWGDDTPPAIPFEDLIIYEVHLKGFTAHPSSGVSYPGTYLGFIEKIDHLRALGVNAVELLPVHEFMVEDQLIERGLTNYWGYNTAAFFAPESSYAAGSVPGCQVSQFKTLVRELHKAGIEVILDVVYNHSGEGNELGPTLSFRGIDNPTYYILDGPAEQPGRRYANFTGCGNCLKLSDPAVLRLVLDSLRYWVEVMHVDGFRFDLASVLGRDNGASFVQSAAFFLAVAQDPVLCRVKLIAEPWDLGTYQVGNFPVDWSEWNGRYRDCARRFLRGDQGVLAELGWRLTGSADLYGDDGRSPYHSVNFITCHDGFTMSDLFSYTTKRNEENGEGNRDGTDENLSWNCGVEGTTEDPSVLALRRRLAKNAICLLLFSSGTPMLLGGDEFLRTQRGNNNAYCQDNDISWFDWSQLDKEHEMFQFVRGAIAVARAYPVLRRGGFFNGADPKTDSIPDISWFGPDGNPPAWDDPASRTICYRLDGRDARAAEHAYELFLVFHSGPGPVSVQVPATEIPGGWVVRIDTAITSGEDLAEGRSGYRLGQAGEYEMRGHSMLLMAAGHPPGQEA